MIHPIVVTSQADGNFSIMWMQKDAKDKDTYTEGVMKPGHPLYELVQERVGMLNMALGGDADDAELEGVGIVFKNGICTVQLSDEEHAKLGEA